MTEKLVTRAERRHQDKRAKVRTKKLLELLRMDTTPKNVGRWSTTRRKCSCWMCSPAPFEFDFQKYKGHKDPNKSYTAYNF